MKFFKQVIRFLSRNCWCCCCMGPYLKNKDDNKKCNGLTVECETFPILPIISPITEQEDEECENCREDNNETYEASIYVNEDRLYRVIPNYNNVESIIVQHCNIPECKSYFPSSLRILKIKYSQMSIFEPLISDTIASIDLSFNNLTNIPKCFYTLMKSNPFIQTNLKNNDFWFNAYSNVSQRFIVAGNKQEIKLAHQLNLVGSNVLALFTQFEEDSSSSSSLKDNVMNAIIDRDRNVRTTYANPENVHLASIQKHMRRNLEIIEQGSDSAGDLGKSPAFLQEMKEVLRCEYSDFAHIIENETYHPGYDTMAYRVLYNVFRVIQRHEHADTMFQVLKQEMNDSKNTCTSGQITRLVNVLTGFVPEIIIGISRNEELSDRILIIRKGMAQKHPSLESYMENTIPVVWQLLEDMCIPDVEHAAWLEYI